MKQQRHSTVGLCIASAPFNPFHLRLAHQVPLVSSDSARAAPAQKKGRPQEALGAELRPCSSSFLSFPSTTLTSRPVASFTYWVLVFYSQSEAFV